MLGIRPCLVLLGGSSPKSPEKGRKQQKEREAGRNQKANTKHRENGSANMIHHHPERARRANKAEKSNYL